MFEFSKNREVLRRFSNLVLRLSASSARFLGLVYLAKILPDEHYAIFGLFSVIVAYFNIVGGGELHAFSQRSFVASAVGRRLNIVWNHFFGISFIYLLLIPPSLLIFYFELLPFDYLLAFYVILLLEHAAKEIYRFLVSLDKQLWASATFFVRLSWPIPFLFFVELEILKGSLFETFLFWIFSLLASNCLALFILFKNVQSQSERRTDFKWLKSAFKVSFFYFAVVVSQHTIIFLNNNLITHLFEPQVYGAFFLFLNISLGVGAIVDSAVTTFFFPKTLKSVNKSKAVEETFSSFFAQTVLVSLVAALFIFVLAKPTIIWIDKVSYIDLIWMLYILIGVSIFQNMSTPISLLLYAKGFDKELAIFDLSYFVFYVVLLSVFLFSMADLILAFPLSLLVGSMMRSIGFYYLYKRKVRAA